jgi:acyl carrier protein
MNDRDILFEIIAKELDVERSAISEGSTLDELGADSPHLLELALAIEAQFGITVPDADLARLRTAPVSDVITYVQRRKGG